MYLAAVMETQVHKEIPRNLVFIDIVVLWKGGLMSIALKGLSCHKSLVSRSVRYPSGNIFS